MNGIIATLFLFVLAFNGCGTAFQGIKMRVVSPAMEEAFRKVSLAFSLDGYEITSVSPAQFHLETEWREAKEKELAAGDRSLGAKLIECKLTLRMEVRGKLYDVFCTPMLRYTSPDGTVRENVAGATHPLRMKWEEVLRQLLEQEHRDED